MLPTSPGYVLEGTQWSNPGHITYSIAPDGTVWDQGVNNLNASLNAEIGPGAWQEQIAKALATWESVANINISPTSDSGAQFNSYGPEQGDPSFGDIRIAGYNFQNPGLLAQTYDPPPGGWTAAGDSDLNTGFTWSLGSGYDLFSVELHEMGHALGLGEAPDPSDVMYMQYQGVRSGLGAGDIAGIQYLYGARTQDSFQQQGQATSAATAVDVSSYLNAQGLGVVGGASLATIGDVEYFKYTAPNLPGLSMQAVAAAAGVSMLSPEIQILDASGNLLAQQANSAQWSDNASATVNLVPGEQYIIAVKGATNDVFSVGAYQLQINVQGLPQPAPPSVGGGSGSTSPSQGSGGSSTVGIPPTTTPSHQTQSKPHAKPHPHRQVHKPAIPARHIAVAAKAPQTTPSIKRATLPAANSTLEAELAKLGLLLKPK